MTRNEEINQKAIEIYYNDFPQLIAPDGHDVTTGEALRWAFGKGAEWADEHPRTDIILPDSINYLRMILIRKFCNLAKKYPDKQIKDIPELKESYDMVDDFDAICEAAGFKLNEDTGFYERVD